MVWAGEAVLVAFTYIGTVVGAGFASGREIQQFFLQAPQTWTVAVGIALAAFLAVGLPLVRLGYVAGDTVAGALAGCTGERLAQLSDWVISLFLFGGLCIMIAGGGASIRQVLGVPLWAGLPAMAVISWLTVRSDIAGLKVANGLVVPLLVLITGIVWWVVHGAPAAPNPSVDPVGVGAASGSAVLYAFFNTALALPVILSLGASASSEKGALVGLLLGVAAIGALILAVGATLLASGDEPFNHEIPMLHIAAGASPWLAHLYFVALLGEIYTTAIGNLFGAAKSLQARLGISLDRAAASCCALALALSYFGFARLVETLYPLFGYCMCGLIVLAGCRWIVVTLNKRTRAF